MPLFAALPDEFPAIAALVNAAYRSETSRQGRTRARRLVLAVINVRVTLIAWYERCGYSLTRETRPFPYHDRRFGVPRLKELFFVILKKRVGRDDGDAASIAVALELPPPR